MASPPPWNRADTATVIVKAKDSDIVGMGRLHPHQLFFPSHLSRDLRSNDCRLPVTFATIVALLNPLDPLAFPAKRSLSVSPLNKDRSKRRRRQSLHSLHPDTNSTTSLHYRGIVSARSKDRKSSGRYIKLSSKRRSSAPHAT